MTELDFLALLIFSVGFLTGVVLGNALWSRIYV